jgi:hypothetical protein
MALYEGQLMSIISISRPCNQGCQCRNSRVCLSFIHLACIVSWLLAWVCFFLGTNLQNVGMSCWGRSASQLFPWQTLGNSFITSYLTIFWRNWHWSVHWLVDCKPTLTNSSQGRQAFIDLMLFISGHTFSPKTIVYVDRLKYVQLKRGRYKQGQ